jgi:hypothetical protein
LRIDGSPRGIIPKLSEGQVTATTWENSSATSSAQRRCAFRDDRAMGPRPCSTVSFGPESALSIGHSALDLRVIENSAPWGLAELAAIPRVSSRGAGTRGECAGSLVHGGAFGAPVSPPLRADHKKYESSGQKVSFWSWLFSNPGRGCQCCFVDPYRIHGSLRGRRISPA